MDFWRGCGYVVVVPTRQSRWDIAHLTDKTPHGFCPVGRLVRHYETGGKTKGLIMTTTTSETNGTVDFTGEKDRPAEITKKIEYGTKLLATPEGVFTHALKMKEVKSESAILGGNSHLRSISTLNRYFVLAPDGLWYHAVSSDTHCMVKMDYWFRGPSAKHALLQRELLYANKQKTEAEKAVKNATAEIERLTKELGQLELGEQQ